MDCRMRASAMWPDTHLGHDRNGDSFLNALDHGRIAHTGDAAGGTNVSGDALQRHHRAGAGILRDFACVRAW